MENLKLKTEENEFKIIREARHREWLRSLKKRKNGKGGVVIQMTAVYTAKTATVLSERELEVLQLISFGYSSAAIAKRLNLSSHTITNHRKNMLTRSRCGNFPELVRVAINEDLLP